MTSISLGQIVCSFIEDNLKTQKGLRPLSIRSYRDTLRMFLIFAARDAGRRIARLSFADLTFERVAAFLRHLEAERHNQIRTRNQRLAALHTFFEYVASRAPEMIAVAERIAAIPTKRTPLNETRFLERDQVATLFAALPEKSGNATRDRALLLFLYNTGARAQEVADVTVANVELGPQPRVHLHGKGDKWRSCPLWEETARQLGALLEARRQKPGDIAAPVFTSRSGRRLTRFGIYKIVRRRTQVLDTRLPSPQQRHISPHVFRHTTAVHLLESGVEVNVIRGWLGHATLLTTNRYAEISAKAKEAALSACQPPVEASSGFRRSAVWRDDQTLLDWLSSL
jgi:site-specific recombinase XerD